MTAEIEKGRGEKCFPPGRDLGTGDGIKLGTGTGTGRYCLHFGNDTRVAHVYTCSGRILETIQELLKAHVYTCSGRNLETIQELLTCTLAQGEFCL